MKQQFRLPGGELEYAVLAKLWELGSASARDIYAQVGEPQGLVYTTTAKVLDRLHVKRLVSRERKIARAERTLAASRVGLHLAEKRYTVGLSDIVELEDAERNYTADEAAYANALYGFSVAKAAVDQATARSFSR
jgi:predicted transcriptional regulator